MIDAIAPEIYSACFAVIVIPASLIDKLFLPFIRRAIANPTK